MDILLVEDDARLAKRIQQVLAEERHRVEVVGDGELALARAENAPFDCFILDILLPGMNGLALCRALRKKALTTPILFLTALEDVQDKVRGLDMGADDYLAKPFSFEELLARLRALERRHTNTLQLTTHLQLDALSLNLLTREVLVENVSIELTVREFALLEYLLIHSNKAVTRSQILNAVWPSDADVNTTIVDTYIHYLRYKIEHFPNTPRIRTLRGVGYMIISSN